MLAKNSTKLKAVLKCRGEQINTPTANIPNVGNRAFAIRTFQLGFSEKYLLVLELYTVVTKATQH